MSNKVFDNKIEIFSTNDGQVELQVQFDEDTVWLTQAQMAFLFSQTKQNVSLHINNCFRENELEKEAVVKESLTTAADGKRYKTQYYNLDVIISVGYRVKSQRGTQFRQWATKRLREYLEKGYTLNEKRLEQKNQEVRHLKDGIRILSRAIEVKVQDAEKNWLSSFAKGLELLDDWDHETLDRIGRQQNEACYPSYADYMDMIAEMYSDFRSDVFARPKDRSFESSINQIRQSFGGKELYPSLEEKAANLLYFVIKNHSFVDGNKRIDAACFLLFLERNGILNTLEGAVISNDALASLTLFIASSKPEEADSVKQLIISILVRNLT